MKARIWRSVWWFCFAMSSTLSGQTAVLEAQDSDLAVSNVCQYLGRQRWSWKVFIKAPESVLANIQCVEYVPPASIQRPPRRVCEIGDPATPFAETGTDWGVFQIAVLVTFKSGETRRLTHMLQFESKPRHHPLDIRVDDRSNRLRPDGWEGTVWLDSRPEVLDQIQLVQYRLPLVFRQLAVEEVEEVFDRGVGNKGFTLSGIGSTGIVIEIRVFFKDGTYQDLRHWITF